MADLDQHEAAVLRHVHAEPGSSGAAISRATKLSSSKIYPALMWLETAGLLTAEWEGGEDAARPRRRLYTATERGVAQAASLPPVRYPSNPSPSAKFGRWIMALVQRLMGG